MYRTTVKQGTLNTKEVAVTGKADHRDSSLNRGHQKVGHPLL